MNTLQDSIKLLAFVKAYNRRKTAYELFIDGNML